MLFERKNKERVVAVVAVNTTGRSIVMGEELATYDKVALMIMVVIMVMVIMKMEVVVVVMIVILVMTMVLTMMEDVEEVTNYHKVIVYMDDT